MMCLGFEPGAAGWKAQTNPLSYGGTPTNNLIGRPMVEFLANKLQNNSYKKNWKKFVEYLNSQAI